MATAEDLTETEPTSQCAICKSTDVEVRRSDWFKVNGKKECTYGDPDSSDIEYHCQDCDHNEIEPYVAKKEATDG